VAGRYDFTIVTNTDFSRTLTWNDENGNPVNLTGWSAHMQIRSWPTPSLLADISTTAGTIGLGGGAGTITLRIAASVTSVIPAGVAKYDLFVTNVSSLTSCLLYGDVIVQRGVTT
jgi:hypothetical protein